MKTNKQNKQEKKNSGSEFQSRSEQLSGNNNTNNQTAPRKSFTEAMAEVDAAKRNPSATEKAPEKDKTTETAPTKSIRPYVNFSEREHNRQMAVDKVLAALKRWMPKQYELAEVVGKWIWITFPEQPIERVRADLSQLGFHWNNTRKCWQHPCGETLPRGQQEPRDKYATYFPADQVAA